MRLLALALALLAWTGGTSAQWDWEFIDNVKDWFSDVRRSITSRLLDSDEFRDLNRTTRHLLASGDLSALSRNEAASLPPRFWAAVGAGPIMTLQDSVRRYVRDNKLRDAPFVSQELDILRDTNVSQARAVELLRSIINQDTFGLRKERLVRLLGRPEDWNEDSITMMKDIVFFLPLTDLTRVRDRGALQMLYDEVRHCMGTKRGTRSRSCPSETDARGEGTGDRSQYFLSLRTWLLRELYGDPKDWSPSRLEDLGDVALLPPLFLPQLNEDFFENQKSQIYAELQSDGRKQAAVGREIVENLLRWRDVGQASADQVQAFREELRNPRLLQYLYRSDLPAQVVENDRALKSELDKLALDAVRAGTLDGGTLEALMLGYATKDRFSVEEVRAEGDLLALAPARALNRTSETYQFSTTEKRNLANTIIRTFGDLAPQKLLALKGNLMELPATGTSLDLNNIPDPLWPAVSRRYLRDLVLSNRISVLGKNVTFPPELVALLVSPSTISPDRLRDVPLHAIHFYPFNKMENLNKNAVKPIGLRSPPAQAYSRVGVLVGTRTYGGGAQINMDADADAARFLRAVDARRARVDGITRTLELMRDTAPTRGACQALKDKLVEGFAQDLGTQNEGEVFQLLSPVQMEQLPICVVAAFGEGRVRTLPDTSKGILFDRLVRGRRHLLTTDALTKSMAETLVSEGLRAKGWPRVITAHDVTRLGELLLFAPPDVLRSVTVEAAPTAMRFFNDLAATTLMPCLDGARRGALGDIVVRALGEDPATWSTVRGACCLLYTLPSGVLSRIPRGSLVGCGCPRPTVPPQMAAVREVECRAQLGGDYDAEMWARENVGRVQALAALQLLDPTLAPNQRGRRAIRDVSICDRASVSGADDVSTAEVAAAAGRELLRCLAALGSRPMPFDKAEALLYGVLRTLPYNSMQALNNSLIADMRHILGGVRPREVEILPRLVYQDFDDAVAVFGDRTVQFSDEQRAALADRVVGDGRWRRVSEMTAADIAAAGRLFCAANETLINMFNNDHFRAALPVLGTVLDGCDRDRVLRPLATKAKGLLNLSPTTAALEVQELGVLLQGLNPEDIAGLPGDAFSGVLPQVMAGLDPAAVARMTPDHIRSLPPVVAQTLTGSQRGALSGAQLAALTEAQAEGGARGAALSSLLFSVAVAALVLLR